MSSVATWLSCREVVWKRAERHTRWSDAQRLMLLIKKDKEFLNEIIPSQRLYKMRQELYDHKLFIEF